MIVPETTTRVECLRVQGGGPDTPARRLRLAARLGSADLRPPGLPASAVLIVRRITGLRVGAQWDRAAREALAAVATRAARPSAGRLAQAAEAVLFLDQGELLGCLALDIQAGVVWDRWWWQSYLRSSAGSPQLSLERALAAQLPALPAALHYLNQWGAAIAVLSALAPANAIALIAGLALHYEAPTLAVPLASRRPTQVAQAPAVEFKQEYNPMSVEPMRAVGAAPDGPWANIIGAGVVPSSLAPEQRALLGIALAMHQRAAAVRSAHFARAFAHWWLALLHPARPDFAPPPPAAPAAARPHDQEFSASVPHPIPRPPPARTPPAPSGTSDPAITDSGPHRSLLVTPDPSITPAPTQPVDDTPRSSAERADHPDNSPLITAPSSGMRGPSAANADHPSDRSIATSRPAPPANADMGKPAATMIAPDDIAPVPETATAERESAWAVLEAGTVTGLGGVLFLINLMIHLDLLEQFPPGLSCGPWGTLELLAHGLLADARAWEGDPLWAALAALEGRFPGHMKVRMQRHRRTNTRRGTDWKRRPFAAHAHALPATWLKEIDGGEPLVWRRRGRWLKVWLEAGPLLYDGPEPPGGARTVLMACIGQAAAERPLAEARADDPGPDCAGQAPNWASPIQRRWLSTVAPFARLRLGRALGLDKPLTELDAALLLRPARLYVSATHIDLVMSLNMVSVPVRRAGLDRDPGWLVDFGRVIKFYFE